MVELRCKLCGSPAVYPSLCRAHFRKNIEGRFKANVRRNRLFSKDDVLTVAVSGGKDSLTALYLTSHLFKNEVHCLTIDEGIKGYREHTLKNVRRFCREWGIPLHICSFAREFGFDLDGFHGPNPCSICGVLRRHLMNAKSRELGDVLVTGHNMDDEAQSIVMNLIQGDLPRLSRMGWVAGSVEDSRFTRRVKPLRTISEKETTTFWFSNFPDIDMSECPYARTALRDVVRRVLNDFALKNPGAKSRVLEWSDANVINPASRVVSSCRRCGEPTSAEVCETCKVLERYAKRKGKGSK